MTWSEKYPKEKGAIMDERDNDQELAEGWTSETQAEYEQWCREQDAIPSHEVTRDDYLAAMDADLPPHKRRGWLEKQIDSADLLEDR